MKSVLPNQGRTARSVTICFFSGYTKTYCCVDITFLKACPPIHLFLSIISPPPPLLSLSLSLSPTDTITHRGVSLVVSHDVVAERSEQDHSNHGREEDGDEDGVDETKPLHIALRHRTQNVVPS